MRGQHYINLNDASSIFTFIGCLCFHVKDRSSSFPMYTILSTIQIPTKKKKAIWFRQFKSNLGRFSIIVSAPPPTHIYIYGHVEHFLFQNLLTDAFVLQVSRSIGDVYLKKAEFNRAPLYAKFRLREPFKRQILSSEPSISVNELQPHDQFLIFASDGLWEHLSNQEAVDIVQNHPHSVRYSSWQWWFLFCLCVYLHPLVS